MPNPIYLQQRQDPWEALLPQLLGNLFLAKIKHGWDMETAAAESEAKATTYAKQLDLQKQKEVDVDRVKREGARISDLEMLSGGKTATPLVSEQRGGLDPRNLKSKYDVQTFKGKQYLVPKKEGFEFDPVSRQYKAKRIEAGPTFTKLEGETFFNWVNDKPLSPKQQQLVDRKFKETGQSPEQVKANAKARIDAKVESFNSLMGRPPTANEKRAMIINDPYGILAPDETNNVPQEAGGVPTKKPGETVSDYLKRITP